MIITLEHKAAGLGSGASSDEETARKKSRADADRNYLTVRTYENGELHTEASIGLSEAVDRWPVAAKLIAGDLPFRRKEVIVESDDLAFPVGGIVAFPRPLNRRGKETIALR